MLGQTLGTEIAIRELNKGDLAVSRDENRPVDACVSAANALFVGHLRVQHGGLTEEGHAATP